MKKRTAHQLLTTLNTTLLKLHKRYEDLFWIAHMGDHSVDAKKDRALKELDAFRTDRKWLDKIEALITKVSAPEQKKLQAWQKYFSVYQTPPGLLPLKEKITKLETQMEAKVSRRTEGYIDPSTKKFVKASKEKMRSLLRIHDQESVRKACFEGLEKLTGTNLSDYVRYVKLLNQYARGLGFEDFYAYKLHTEEGMTKQELFALFDRLYEKTKFAFADIRAREKKMPGLRKPWNFGYLLSGDFTKEEDPYFPFTQAVERWGQSFAALGITFHGATLTLDLLDREGKYSNGFCHWPELVHFTHGKRAPGSANFTCNVVYGQPGSSRSGYETLFHEGGHAAHLLNSEQTEVCLNHEYPPMSTAWAETNSIFMDTLLSSIEWRTRYAQTESGTPYPFELFVRRLKQIEMVRPLGLSSILFVADFERRIYEHPRLTTAEVKKIAKQMFKKHFDRSVDSLAALNIPHIYSWNSACSYHAYGLADLAVQQWRDYFYKKYQYLVDNPKVGTELRDAWTHGSSKTFKEFVIQITGLPLSPDPWLENATRSTNAIISRAKSRIKRLAKVPRFKGKINLGATVRMVSGKKVLADSAKGFEQMAKQYATWLELHRNK
jgi:oligoendopeptidase F